MVQTATLTASDEQGCGIFGNSVSISGNTIVVGDPAPYCYPGEPGAAYVFVQPAGGWGGTLTQTAKLTASDAATGDGVGASVSIDHNTVVVGAPYQSSGAGAAYVFVKPSGGWTSSTQTAKLNASDAAANDNFGYSVSLSGSVAVAGAPYEPMGGNNYGAAYVYVEPSGGWANSPQTAKLTALDTETYGSLGLSVSISGTTVVAGAEGTNVNNQAQGAAYVFVEPSVGWTNATQVAKLTASNGNAGDRFGASVATNGGLIVAGAPWFSNAPNQNSAFSRQGAAYIFVKPSSGWASATQAATLTGSDARFSAFLGTSVAVSGTAALSGALFNNRNLGAGYVFSAFTPQ